MSEQSPPTRGTKAHDAEWRDPANWHGGPLGLYHNKRDPRPFVPKRHPMLGVTVNFAHPAGVGFIAGVLLFAGLLAYLSRGQHR